jgi:hypothetical protein
MSQALTMSHLNDWLGWFYSGYSGFHPHTKEYPERYKRKNLNLIFLPFLGSVASGLFGRYLGPKGSSILTVFLLITTFLMSVVMFYEVALNGSPVYIKLMTWMNSELLNVDWGFFI